MSKLVYFEEMWKFNNDEYWEYLIYSISIVTWSCGSMDMSWAKEMGPNDHHVQDLGIMKYVNRKTSNITMTLSK